MHDLEKWTSSNFCAKGLREKIESCVG